MFEQIVFRIFWVISNVSKENKIKVDHSDFYQNLWCQFGEGWRMQHLALAALTSLTLSTPVCFNL